MISAGERSDVELSFDDGNRSDIEIAAPALRPSADSGARSFRWPAASTSRAVWAGPTWSSCAGRVCPSAATAGATCRGDELTARPSNREFVDARSVLEDASGAEIDSAACPLGRYDRASLQGLKRAGYQAVYTSDRFPARATSWLQARYSITADDTIDSVKGILHGKMRTGEVRNVLASVVKRSR